MVKKGYFIGYALLVIFFLLALLPMLALSYFNQPSPADDYCYIDTVQKYGFWQAQSFYYNGWSGRYFAYFLAHANPLLYHFPAGFKIFSVLLILFFLASSYFLGKMLLGSRSGGRMSAAFMMVVFGLYVFYMPSIAEGFFWMITSLTNTLPVLLLFWLPAFLPDLKDNKYRISHLVVSSLLIFMAVGCSETALLFTGLVLGFAVVHAYITRHKVSLYWIVIFAVYAVSAYLLVSAPGNKVRMQGNEMSGEIIPSVYGAIVLTVLSAAKWLAQTPVLIVSAVFWVVVRTSGSKPRFRYPLLNLVLTWLVFFGILAACFFPTFYGGLAILGELNPPERTFNTVYLLFLSGWFYCIYVTAHFVGGNINSSAWLGVAAAVVMLVYVYRSPNFRAMYRDLRDGTAYRYDQQIRDRYEAVRKSTSDTVRVAPLRDMPVTLFVDDIRVENDHLWNRCYSGYFGKTIILDPELK